MNEGEGQREIKVYRRAAIAGICGPAPNATEVISVFFEADGRVIRLDLTEDAVARLPAVVEYAASLSVVE